MSRLPDYKLKILDKKTGTKGEVGAAWLNEDNSISIQLNVCVVLERKPDVVITLFPNDQHRLS